MTPLKWTRERAKSGPCDTLEDRWELRRGGGKWAVYDRTSGWVGGREFPSMKAAKHAAIALALADREQVA